LQKKGSNGLLIAILTSAFSRSRREYSAKLIRFSQSVRGDHDRYDPGTGMSGFVPPSSKGDSFFWRYWRGNLTDPEFHWAKIAFSLPYNRRASSPFVAIRCSTEL